MLTRKLNLCVHNHERNVPQGWPEPGAALRPSGGGRGEDVTAASPTRLPHIELTDRSPRHESSVSSSLCIHCVLLF